MKILENRYKKKILEIKNNNKKIKEKQFYKFINYIIFIFSSAYKFFPEITAFSVIFILIIYLSVSLYSKKYIYSSLEEIPYNNAALVLGTSKYLYNGKINMYFKFRMDAAYQLYKSGKVKYILVSGDNRSKSYNEPKQMRIDLIKLGVNKKHIFLDFAGFRTRDSIIRANKVFELNNFTIVSQPFHNERAVFIARQKNINAIAYNAKNVRKLYRLRQFPRELGARILMFADILFNRPPKFYGDTIKIEEIKDTANNKSNKIYKKQ
ncbi:ElyC/SanA/YdcF family protein [uncultured Brachyspira sp.]|uniref:SanA/YdcF family protein n=1 Tax=uncultured Brachyspira sp. TaxID=221953 RepID=UPI0025DDB522|nr:ElyC/SanA/YdcF family protein [uncultured Brachyspira sp.]